MPHPPLIRIFYNAFLKLFFVTIDTFFNMPVNFCAKLMLRANFLYQFYFTWASAVFTLCGPVTFHTNVILRTIFWTVTSLNCERIKKG